MDEVKAEDVESAVMAPIGSATENSGPPELQTALGDLKLMVKLQSIENPFGRWRGFSKEISAVWSEDVSVIDCIREQR